MYSKNALNGFPIRAVIFGLVAFLVAFCLIVGSPACASDVAAVADTEVYVNDTFIVSEVVEGATEYYSGKYLGYKYESTPSTFAGSLKSVPLSQVYLNYLGDFGKYMLMSGGVDDDKTFIIHLVDWDNKELVLERLPDGTADPVYGGTFSSYSDEVDILDDWVGGWDTDTFGGFSIAGSGATETVKLFVGPDHGTALFENDESGAILTYGSYPSGSFYFDIGSAPYSDVVVPWETSFTYNTAPTEYSNILNYYGYRFLWGDPVAFSYGRVDYVDAYTTKGTVPSDFMEEYSFDYLGSGKGYGGYAFFKEFWIESVPHREGYLYEHGFTYSQTYTGSSSYINNLKYGADPVANLVDLTNGNNKGWVTYGASANGSALGLGSSGTVITTSQNLYVVGDNSTEKFYLWLNRSNYGSSLILEGSGVPPITLTNGGKEYTDNYYTALDMFDTLGNPYEYSVQLTWFDANSQVQKRTVTFSAEPKETPPDEPDNPDNPDNPDDPDDPIVIPPIDIPGTIGGIISSPSELPSVDLPFDFEAPLIHIDLTSSFDFAFNNSWLGVSDAYTSVSRMIDALVRSIVPTFNPEFLSFIVSIEGQTYEFTQLCDTIKNEYAFPFYNFVVRFSSLVPSVVWIVFDIFVFYQCARLVVFIVTCPLSEVIRRYF